MKVSLLPSAEPPAQDRAWDLVRGFLAALAAIADSPGALREHGFISRAARAALLFLLRPAEAIARRLLLIAAAAIRLNQVHHRRASVRASVRVRCGRGGFAHADSAYWPVTFVLSPRGSAGAARSVRRPSAREARFSAMALAERYEALVRVVADPAAHAARLARLLARRRGESLAQRIFRGPRRVRGFSEAMEHARRGCAPAAAAFGADTS